MTAFATSTDLQVLDPDVSTAQAELVLDLVSADIRAGVGWDVDQDTGSVTEVGCWIWTVVIPARNVTDVTVTADGVTLVQGTDYLLKGSVVTLMAPALKVVVDYTAGYPEGEVPDVFRSVCLDYAQRRLANPAGERSWSLGDEAHTFAGTGLPADLDAGTDARLDDYRFPGGIA